MLANKHAEKSTLTCRYRVCAPFLIVLHQVFVLNNCNIFVLLIDIHLITHLFSVGIGRKRGIRYVIFDIEFLASRLHVHIYETINIET